MYILAVSENVLFFICGLGILQGIILSAIIYFHPKSDRSVNLFLALFILGTSAIMTFPFAVQVVGWQNSFFVQPIPLLTGPFLYLYLRSFKEKISFRKAYPHFIIFFVLLFFSYWNLSVLSKKYPTSENIPPEALRSPTTLILVYVRPLQQIIYFILSLKTFKSYQRSIRLLFSETSRIDLGWAKFLIYGFLFLVLSFILIFPLMLRYPEHFYLLLLINMSLATPYIYIATYKGIMQPTIWQIQPRLNKETVEAEMQEAEELKAITTQPTKPKMIKPGLNVERVQEMTQKIIFLMEEEKLYQETELTLYQLAEKLDVPTYQVSQTIKEGLNKNFYDLVNGYRVNEAKRLLVDPQNKNYTILSVGFEAGFNSKTTFNTVFKKYTGLTPTDFREQQKGFLSPA